jgi:hypothetical protein
MHEVKLRMRDSAIAGILPLTDGDCASKFWPPLAMTTFLFILFSFRSNRTRCDSARLAHRKERCGLRADIALSSFPVTFWPDLRQRCLLTSEARVHFMAHPYFVSISPFPLLIPGCEVAQVQTTSRSLRSPDYPRSHTMSKHGYRTAAYDSPHCTKRA